jgi:hypothetical protein
MISSCRTASVSTARFTPQLTGNLGANVNVSDSDHGSCSRDAISISPRTIVAVRTLAAGWERRCGLTMKYPGTTSTTSEINQYHMGRCRLRRGAAGCGKTAMLVLKSPSGLFAVSAINIA